MDEQPKRTPQLSPREFRTTHWSLVAAATSDSDGALEELCAAYWLPLHSYLHRLGYDSSDADDLTQAFFARLLDKRLLDVADQRRGRFRTFLLTALRRFIINEWKQQATAKQGGGIRHLPIDSLPGEYADIAHDLTPDRLFERQWAMVVLQRAFGELETEHQQTGKQTTFELLVRCLNRDVAAPSYDELACQLHTTPAALRMTVSRMRQRLGELIRDEIRKTVGSDADVDDELGRLFDSLRT